MLEELEEGADLPRRIGEMLAETYPIRQLKMWVEAHCALFEGGTVILRAAMPAIHAPEVAVLAERGNANRRDAVDRIVSRWKKTGNLRIGLAPSDAADRMFLLTTFEGYLTAIDGLGWTSDKYETWLAGLLIREILQDMYSGGT